MLTLVVLLDVSQGSPEKRKGAGKMSELDGYVISFLLGMVFMAVLVFKLQQPGSSSR